MLGIFEPQKSELGLFFFFFGGGGGVYFWVEGCGFYAKLVIYCCFSGFDAMLIAGKW